MADKVSIEVGGMDKLLKQMEGMSRIMEATLNKSITTSDQVSKMMDTMNKAFDKQNKQYRKTIKEAESSSAKSVESHVKIMQERVKGKKIMEGIEHRDKEKRRMLTVATRSKSPMFGFMKGIVHQKFEEGEEAGRLENLTKWSKKRILTREEGEEFEDLKTTKPQAKGSLAKLGKQFEKSFGEGSKWDKMFGGHGKAAAGLMGAGAIGGGMMLGKAIIDSSPMFKQMLKLLNFGIMMVLRPIGDFFGFMLRPILIMLLRKLIIPFYQTALPLLQQFGTILGEQIAGGLEAIIEILKNTATILMNLFDAEKRDEAWARIQEIFGGTINVAETQPEIRDASKVVEAINGQTTATSAKYDKLASQLAMLSNAPKNEAIKEAQHKLAKSINDWTVYLGSKGILNTQGFQKVGAKTVSAHLKIAEGQMTADEAMGWFTQEMFKGGINKMAHGGTINEPILGIGRSGQKYSFGERGSETVVPNGGSTNSPITINVYGDVDDKTMNAFEQRVLEVLNKSNSRRGI